MLTATCGNCGRPKDAAHYGDVYCPDCTSAKREAEQHFAAEHTGAPEGDILYAGRQALMVRAHTANRNFTDPRQFSATRGMIPLPPPGSDRGTPPPSGS
jgi:hypothetical protein